MARKDYDQIAFQNDVGNTFTKPDVKKELVDDNESEIKLILREPLSIESRITITGRMVSIGAYYSTEGTLQCFDNPYDGWKQIMRGLLYRFWNWRILKRHWQSFGVRIRQGMTNTIHVANDAALCLVIMPEVGKWYMDLMEESLTNKYLNWGGGDFYPAFLVRLYRIFKGNSEFVEAPPEPWSFRQPYSEFFLSWDDDDKLSKSMLELCDYHLCWNYLDTKKHRAEFSDRFASINPVEIHAIEYVRKSLGLSTPSIDHRLLREPFYPIPNFVKDISEKDIIDEDHLLSNIVDKNREWCDSPVASGSTALTSPNNL